MSNIPRVLNFIAAWNARDLHRVVAAFTPDAVYHNIPMEPLLGRELIGARLATLFEMFDEVCWSVSHVAETEAGVVLTERLDAFVMGGKPVSVRVMGAFELQGELISAWRDYFDLQEYRRQL